MRDIEEGCAEAVANFERWTDGLVSGNYEIFEEVLALDFEFVSDPVVTADRLNKQAFIEVQRGLNCSAVDFIDVFARKIEDYISTVIKARVVLFDPDSGTREPIYKARLIYSSLWRRAENGALQCFRHHILCKIADEPL